MTKLIRRSEDGTVIKEGAITSFNKATMLDPEQEQIYSMTAEFAPKAGDLIQDRAGREVVITDAFEQNGGYVLYLNGEMG